MLPDQGVHADHAGRKRSHASMEEADASELRRKELRDELAALDKGILVREMTQKPGLFFENYNKQIPEKKWMLKN